MATVKRRIRKDLAVLRAIVIVVLIILAAKCCYGAPHARARELHDWIEAWLLCNKQKGNS